MCLSIGQYVSKAKTLLNYIFHRRNNYFPHLNLACALFGYYRWRCMYLLCGIICRESEAEPPKAAGETRTPGLPPGL